MWVDDMLNATRGVEKARQLTLLGPGGGPYGPPSTNLATAPLNRIAQSWTKLVNSYFGHGETMCLFL